MPLLNVQLKLVISDGFIQEFMDTVPAAVDYWANVSVKERYPERDGWCAIKVAYIREQEASQDGPKVRMDFAEAHVTQGIERILTLNADGKSMVNDAHYNSILKAVQEDDMSNMDVFDVDCVVQAAMFNEIVYG